MRIRLEQSEDHIAVERLTLAAFKTFVFPDGSKPERPNEHYLAHIMRGAPAFAPKLDFVGEIDGEVVANIMYTKSKVVRADGSEVITLTFGPVSVKPELHGQGLAARLSGTASTERVSLATAQSSSWGTPVTIRASGSELQATLA
jgi:predicted N-acetyltransferase YhbS